MPNTIGPFSRVGNESFPQATGMTYLNNSLYILSNETIHKVPPDSGVKEALGTREWWTASNMVAARGKLWLVSQNSLHEADPQNNVHTDWISEEAEWDATTAIAELNGSLYIVSQKQLHEFDMGNKRATPKGPPQWANTEGMAAANGKLSIVSQGRLHEVKTGGGEQAPVPEDQWAGTQSMCSDGKELYIAQEGRIHITSPSGGGYNFFGPENGFRSTSAMVVAQDSLFVIENDLLYRATLPGVWCISWTSHGPLATHKETIKAVSEEQAQLRMQKKQSYWNSVMGIATTDWSLREGRC